MENEVAIVPFCQELASHFRELNTAWLEKYFYVEPKDVEVLNDPIGSIIHKGGHIYFAQWRKVIVGTFALIPEGDGVYELGKMAVNEDYQGKSVGNKLLQHCLAQAAALGAYKVILYSNTKLGPAIHLYRKYGFIEVPLESSDYKRSNIKMEKTINSK